MEKKGNLKMEKKKINIFDLKKCLIKLSSFLLCKMPYTNCDKS